MGASTRKRDGDEPALGVVDVDDVRQCGRWAGGAGDGRVGMLEPPQSGEGGEHVDARPIHACQRHGSLGPAASGADRRPSATIAAPAVSRNLMPRGA